MKARLLGSFCVAALLLGANGHAATGPRLTLVDRTPVVLAGSGFEPQTRVVVTVRAPSLQVTRTVRTTDRGRFRTTFEGLRLTGRLRCAHGLTIVARPARGELLLWHPPKLPDCAAPLPVAPA